MIWSFPLAFSLFLLLIFVIAYLWFFKRNKRASLYYSSLDILPKNYFSIRSFLSPLPTILKIISLCLVILALARPQSINEKSEQNVKGIDIMIVMDISLSMLVSDMGYKLTRLDSSKKVVSEFIEGRVSDRIGLIVFSGESFTRVPLTLDYNLLLNDISKIKPIPSIKQGTAIGVALANAAVRLKNSSPDSRVIVFLTDGENNTGFIDPETALKIVRRNNIKVYTVGLGSVSGKAPIIYESLNQFGIKKREKVLVDSRINKKLMLKMAKETDGEFFMAKNLKSLQNIFNRIDQLEKQNIEVNKWLEYIEHFSAFLQFGIGLYFLSLILSLTWFFKGV